MENKITEATIELADNGYILRYGGTVLVYSDKTGNCYRGGRVLKDSCKGGS